MCNSMQHPEILIHFSRPTELLLLQIPFPSYPHLPVANRKPTVARSLLGSPGRGWLAPLQQPPRFYTGQCQGSLPPGGGRAHRSHLRCHRHAWHFPVGSRELPGVPLAHGSRAVACESALYQQRVRGGCRSLCCPWGGGWNLEVLEQGLVLPPSRPHRAPAHPHRALPHFRAVTTSTSHGVASAPSPRSSRVPRWEKSPRSRAAPRHAINQPRGRCPDPVPSCLCRGAGTAGTSRLRGFPCPSSAAISREADSDSEPGCGRSCCRRRARGMAGFGRGPGIAAGERPERFGHRAAWRCGGTPGLWLGHGGSQDPLSRSRARQSRAG